MLACLLPSSKPYVVPLIKQEPIVHPDLPTACFTRLSHMLSCGNATSCRVSMTPLSPAVPAARQQGLPVQGEQYPRIARQWKIWPFPRGHHRNVVYLPYKGSVWLLADVRFCPLLPPELLLLPPASLQKLPGSQGSSCTSTCE